MRVIINKDFDEEQQLYKYTLQIGLSVVSVPEIEEAGYGDIEQEMCLVMFRRFQAQIAELSPDDIVLHKSLDAAKRGLRNHEPR